MNILTVQLSLFCSHFLSSPFELNTLLIIMFSETSICEHTAWYQK